MPDRAHLKPHPKDTGSPEQGLLSPKHLSGGLLALSQPAPGTSSGKSMLLRGTGFRLPLKGNMAQALAPPREGASEGHRNCGWECRGATPMRIAIYSRSCPNHHQGFTTGCKGERGGSNTDEGQEFGGRGNGGGTPAVPPSSNATERGPPLAGSPPHPPRPASLEEVGWGCGKRA